MRDPLSQVSLLQGRVVRQLKQDLPADHPLNSALADHLVSGGLLIPFKWLDKSTLTSPRVPFVTSPEEWCDGQLFDAGLLTLELLERANAAGADLKDASAWNVIFDGGKPVFCDLTSLEPLKTHPWWAAGQFLRHFILPLWLSKETELSAREFFRMHRDGVCPEVAKSLLGWRRFKSRCWPLLATSSVGVTSKKSVPPAGSHTPVYRRNLIASLRWMLASVAPGRNKPSVWVEYTNERPHYSADALALKKQTVANWMTRLQPDWTLDLGANSGEFSTLAFERGSSVISLDGDHSAIQRLYWEFQGRTGIYPVCAPLDDIHTGRGWAGEEHHGLALRLAGSADLLLMLALIHHLSIACAVSVHEVARLAAKFTRRWLIIEWLEANDPQVQLLCAQRRRDPNEFTVDIQKAAFAQAGFQMVDGTVPLGPTRRLALLEKRV